MAVCPEGRAGERPLEALDDRELGTLRVAVRSVATRFAQSLPYFCSSCWTFSGSYGVLLPLHFLEQHYEWAGNSTEEQLAWC